MLVEVIKAVCRISRLSFLGILYFLILSSCLNPDPPAVFEEDQIEQLLTTGNIKIWNLESRVVDNSGSELDMCLESRLLIFNNTGDAFDLGNQLAICTDSLVSGTWDVIPRGFGENTDSIAFSIDEEEIVRAQIDLITVETLTYTYLDPVTNQNTQDTYEFIN